MKALLDAIDFLSDYRNMANAEANNAAKELISRLWDTETKLKALQAICARIDGVYDDPALMEIGLLQVDELEDIKEIIHYYGVETGK